MKKLTAAIVLAWTAIVVAAEAMEPVVPVMWRRGAVEETARDLREIRAKSGLSRFFVAGPGFNEVMYAPFATNLYAEMGRDLGADVKLAAGRLPVVREEILPAAEWRGAAVSRLGPDGREEAPETVSARWTPKCAFAQMQPEFFVFAKCDKIHTCEF